ncbi:MAG: pyruvate dehydrogenase (acetyl-transferring) E1 component subunit alpha [Pseudohongiella sp.]|nr:pyruvate dehydrogenase (acetyl-transferring) E1 component subunit alpha [Pseudohongiella sp.]MDO9519325.1 pyruvate dehydrogenase (acetyl-transferring) E1 component subunit alpha [Pseudohongiella sp.]
MTQLKKQVASTLPANISLDWLRSAYSHMVLIRAFDKKVVALQRTGQMRTYPSCLGQEAIGVGIGLALQDNDVFVPYYRDQATLFLRGVSLTQIMQVWGGDERGHLFEGAARRDLPLCIPIATQMTHAAGVAIALKSRAEHQACLVTCGDGATSKGDFSEALNLAGLWQLPMVCVINNNQWAISVPLHKQTACQTLAQKAVAAGMEGVQIDGNDVAEVYQAVDRALTKARQGKGPTLIEAVSYRLSDHTTADDATRYRDLEQVNNAWEREPVKRLQSLLHAHQGWSPEQENALLESVRKQVDDAVTAYLSIPPQPADEFLKYQFAEMTTPLALQISWQHERFPEHETSDSNGVQKS